MGIILDIILVLLLAIFLYDGFKRGAVKSLIDIVGYVVVLTLTSWLAGIVADAVFTTFVWPHVLSEINQALQSSAGSDPASQVTTLLNSLPSFVSNTLKFYGVTQEYLISAAQSSSNNIAEDIMKSISPVFINLIKTVAFSTLLVVLTSIFKVFSRTLNRVFNLPILKQINKLLGLVCGALKCVIIIFITCYIIQIVIPMMSNTPEILSQSSIDSTIIFKNIYYNNPLNSIIENFTI